MDNRLEIRSSRLKNIILSLLGILMTSMSAFMLLSGLYGSSLHIGSRLYEVSILYSIFIILIGLFGTLFFGATTLFYIDELQIISRHLKQTKFVHKQIKWSLIF